MQAAIACFLNDNRWFDTIKLISVIKEVPHYQSWSHGNPVGERSKAAFSFYARHSNSGDNFIQVLSQVLIISVIIMRARAYIRVYGRVCDLEMLIKGSAKRVCVMWLSEVLNLYRPLCQPITHRINVTWLLYQIREAQYSR